MHYLLAFSGSFLLSITFLHLLPEAFGEHNMITGMLLLAGFFLQLLIQRFTHGVEHGHNNIAPHHHHQISLMPILIGLSFHAFMEGIPLGIPYGKDATGTSLYLAVAAHKIPEALLATSLVVHLKARKKGLIFLLLFALITPLSSLLTSIMSGNYNMAGVVNLMLPIVAGAFIHIATTIFYESGTKQHVLTLKKTLSILLGLGIGLLTLLFE